MKLSYAAALALSLAACSTTKVAQKEPRDPNAYDALAQNAAMEALMRNFRRVRFEFDSAQITPDTREALAANAEIMERFTHLGVEVEGHCDEIGSTEYNLMLGQRRADAIKKYLVTAGVEPVRVATISYGEERPLTMGTDESALSMNRRAEFRVTVDPSGLARSSTQQLADKGLIPTLAAY